MQQKKDINVRVGNHIQMLREERHLTQEQLSEKLGVTPNHLSAIERGVSGTSLELLEKLCEELDVSADMVLFGRPRTGGREAEFRELLRELIREQAGIRNSMDILLEKISSIRES